MCNFALVKPFKSYQTMSKLGYWQECAILRISEERSTSDHGKEVVCYYLELDISARDANSGKSLNKRYLVVRVLNKKLQQFLLKQRFPSPARLRLYASGFRDRDQANRKGSPLDVYEVIILDNE